jgi:hypothetical protein
MNDGRRVLDIEHRAICPRGDWAAMPRRESVGRKAKKVGLGAYGEKTDGAR